ncbi:sulfurtransferase complex subunit TusB [Gilvimarinus sp. SDUM040013]|uniref:Sulfurtransferase complex subunit TusB n=1 Tax=Gilvimarinus gilvus TaxID=3058038 RepID=A0ABU4RWW5_9GAMM|nr:sulfurtransferase complex subunit TusB [Gilvimarinus sp. SDUM040013]MDO3385732.1 sulfurtransferase complex subunit TusB [Gilvimarinus sp. SDUM040013]MDX6849372.1 sulfurtransferase complex subunit TusB [Gilvimarinus sp. SDUM040013]
MSTLHTVNKSPFQDNSLASCLQLCSVGDSVLLIEDGAYGASQSSPCAKELISLLNEGTRIYVLENDVRARGLQLLLDGIELTDYQGFVQLSSTHRCIQSWY